MAVVKDEIQLHFEGGDRASVEAGLVQGEIGANRGAELEAIYKDKNSGSFLHLISEERMVADPDTVQGFLGGPFMARSGSLAGVGKRTIVANAAGAVALLADALVYADDYNGGTANATTINAALTAIGASKKRLYIKAGNWSINANIAFPSNVLPVFEVGAILVQTASFTVSFYQASLPMNQVFNGASGFITILGSMDLHPEWWGMAGAGANDTAPILAAIEAGAGHRIIFPAGTFICKAQWYLDANDIVGAGMGAGATAQTIIQFAALSTAAAIVTRQVGTTSYSNRLSNIRIEANSWDAILGCRSYGLDIEARIQMDSVYVYGFYKANIFFHNDAVGSGPYNSWMKNVYSTHSKEYGCLVGTGANNMTFMECYFAYNGSLSFGVAPTAGAVGVTRGEYDGFAMMRDGDGNPGTAYYAYLPQSVRVIGGNSSYNGNVGWNFKQGQDCLLEPGYAEGALGSYDAIVGIDMIESVIDFVTIAGATDSHVQNLMSDTSARATQLRVKGILQGSGANKKNFLLSNLQIMLGEDATLTKNAYIQYDQTRDIVAMAPTGGAFLRMGSASLTSKYIEHDGTDLTLANGAFFGAKIVNATAITGAANNGSGLVRITQVSHPYVTGTRLIITGVLGTTEANGTWLITVISGSTYDLVGSAFANAYVSGGATSTPGRQIYYGNLTPEGNQSANIGDYYFRHNSSEWLYRKHTAPTGSTGWICISGCNPNVGDRSGSASQGIDAGTSANADVGLKENGVEVFTLRKQNTAISGGGSGATGANLELIARDNSGTEIDKPIQLTRAALGTLTVNRPTAVKVPSVVATAKVGGRLVGGGSGTDAGCVSSGATDLKSFTILANTLQQVNLDCVRFVNFGTFTSAVSNKRVVALLGSTTVFDTTALAFLAGSWMLEVFVYRTGSSSQRVIARWTCTETAGALPTKTTYTLGAESNTADLIFKLQGTGGATDEIVQKLIDPQYMPN